VAKLWLSVCKSFHAGMVQWVLDPYLTVTFNLILYTRYCSLSIWYINHEKVNGSLCALSGKESRADCSNILGIDSMPIRPDLL
jgi:hypothetical protein